MKHHHTLLDLISTGLALAAIGLQVLAPETVESIRYPALILCVVLVGIPHGAIDHIVTSRIYNLSFNFTDQSKFYIYYLLVMSLMTAFWLIDATFGFIIFVAISIYHFGQADLEYLDLPPSKKRILYLSRGTMILGLIIFSHISYTAPVLEVITAENLLGTPFIQDTHLLLAQACVAQYLLLKLMILFANRDRIGVGLWYPIGDAIVVSSLFYVVDPILAFSVYFGLWHSVGHIREMFDFFGKTGRPMNFRRFALLSIPFTLITFAGLALIYALNHAYGMELQMVSLFFILISVITLPHMLIVEKMYSVLPPS